MEVSEEQRKESASYTYWVREVTGDAAPLPVPRKLSSEDISGLSHPPNLGSVWNRAGTWEEKNLNKWASQRIKELLMSVDSLEFSSGKAEISEVSNCVGDVSVLILIWFHVTGV